MTAEKVNKMLDTIKQTATEVQNELAKKEVDNWEFIQWVHDNPGIMDEGSCSRAQHRRQGGVAAPSNHGGQVHTRVRGRQGVPALPRCV